MGGKNPFLGWAYVAAAGLFVLLAVAGTIRHLLKPRCPFPHLVLAIVHSRALSRRRLGDMSLLSWNR